MKLSAKLIKIAQFLKSANENNIPEEIKKKYPIGEIISLGSRGRMRGQLQEVTEPYKIIGYNGDEIIFQSSKDGSVANFSYFELPDLEKRGIIRNISEFLRITKPVKDKFYDLLESFGYREEAGFGERGSFGLPGHFRQTEKEGALLSFDVDRVGAYQNIIHFVLSFGSYNTTVSDIEKTLDVLYQKAEDEDYKFTFSFMPKNPKDIRTNIKVKGTLEKVDN